MGHEDTVVVETLAAQAMPRISEELHVAADALALSFRKLQQKYLAKGWGLETSNFEPTPVKEQPSQPLTSLVK